MLRTDARLNARIRYRNPYSRVHYGHIIGVLRASFRNKARYKLIVENEPGIYRITCHPFARLIQPPIFLTGKEIWARVDVARPTSCERYVRAYPPFLLQPQGTIYRPITVSHYYYERLAGYIPLLPALTEQTKPAFYRLMLLELWAALLDGNRGELLDYQRASA